MAFALVEHCDEFEEARLRIRHRLVPFAMHQLLLQTREERLHRRVVPAVAATAHAAPNAVLRQLPLIRADVNRCFRLCDAPNAVLRQLRLILFARVLTAAIRVRQQPRFRASRPDRLRMLLQFGHGFNAVEREPARSRTIP